MRTRNGRLKRGLEIHGQELQCYAPGNGSLHFVWTTMNYPYVATGRAVKRWHVLRYLRLKDGLRLVNDGWKPHYINGQWQLVKSIKRANKNTLKLDGEYYTYQVKPLRKRDGNDVWACDLTVWTKSKNEVLRKVYGPKFEVKNLSNLAVIRFFLSHEKELK